MKRSLFGLSFALVMLVACGSDNGAGLPWIEGGDSSTFPALLLNVEGDAAQMSSDLRAGLFWTNSMESSMFSGQPLADIPSILSIDLASAVLPEAALPEGNAYAVAKIVVVDPSLDPEQSDYWMSETDGYSLWWLPQSIENYDNRFGLGAGWHLMRHAIRDINCDNPSGDVISYDVEPVSPATMVRLELGTNLEDSIQRACP